jgi:Fe-S-cluster containining protein
MADDSLESATSVAQRVEFLTGLSSPEQQLLEATRHATTQLLQGQTRLERAWAAAACALNLAREHRRLAVVQEPASACGEGCHWCCYLKVSVTAPEVLLLARHLQQHTAPEALARIQTRALELTHDARIFSADEKAEAKLACPLLSDSGACSAYEARPLACRGWNSFDAEVCRRFLDDDAELPFMNEPQARAYAIVGIGLRQSAASAGLVAEMLELTSALAIALGEPNALERWLAGEAVFEAARAER